MSSSRPGWRRLATPSALIAVSIASLGAPAAGAAPRRSVGPPAARSAAAGDRALAIRSAAVRMLAGRRRHLARCMQRHPERCGRWQTALQHAERRLVVAETRLADVRGAPVVTLSGQTLSWAPVAGASAYVLRRRGPGIRESRLIVIGTSVTPPAREGETVEYLLRTAARDSEWSAPVSITYPLTAPLSGETGSGAGNGPGSGAGTGPGSPGGGEGESGAGREGRSQRA